MLNWAPTASKGRDDFQAKGLSIHQGALSSIIFGPQHEDNWLESQAVLREEEKKKKIPKASPMVVVNAPAQGTLPTHIKSPIWARVGSVCNPHVTRKEGWFNIREMSLLQEGGCPWPSKRSLEKEPQGNMGGSVG